MKKIQNIISVALLTSFLAACGGQNNLAPLNLTTGPESVAIQSKQKNYIPKSQDRFSGRDLSL